MWLRTVDDRCIERSASAVQDVASGGLVFAVVVKSAQVCPKPIANPRAQPSRERRCLAACSKSRAPRQSSPPSSVSRRSFAEGSAPVAVAPWHHAQTREHAHTHPRHFFSQARTPTLRGRVLMRAGERRHCHCYPKLRGRPLAASRRRARRASPIPPVPLWPGPPIGDGSRCRR